MHINQVSLEGQPVSFSLVCHSRVEAFVDVLNIARNMICSVLRIYVGVDLS